MAVIRPAARRASLVLASLVLSIPLIAGFTYSPPAFVETGLGPSAIAVADFNGDGKPDFATGNLDSTVTVRFGDGAGGFPTSATYTGFSTPAVIVAVDLNKDGHPDLVVSNSPSFGDPSLNNTLAILLNNGTGVFAAPSLVTLTGTASGVAAGDFNEDGNVDVLAAQANGVDALSFLPGDGSGGFGAATHPSLPPGHSAIKLTAADFNGDGHLDAAIAAGATVDWIFGNGGGAFSAATVFTFPSPQGEGGAVAIASADLDKDGDIDVATVGGNVVAGASVFKNNGSGVFTWSQFSMPQAPANPVELALADLDGDGTLDIVTANTFGCPPWGSNLSARPGNGDGTFGAAEAISVGYTNCINSQFQPVAVAAVDLNCDGKADLLAPLQNSTASFHNVAVILSPGGGSCNDVTPPVISAPPDITVNAAAACLRHLSDADIGTATATDDSGCVTVSKTGVPAGNDFPLGTTTITWTATDCHGNTATATQKVTVVDATPPVVTAPANVSVVAGASCTANVNPGTATATDACGLPAVQGVRSDGQPLLAPYPIGTTTITWTATDSSGNQASALQTVAVAAPPPVLSAVTANPASLWPPNHKMVDVTVNYSVSGCGSVTCVIDAITSNEPENGLGDGDTGPDWQIVDAHHVRLRAERAGGGSGRVYAIHITCTDSYGNSTSSTVTVTVAHNR